MPKMSAVLHIDENAHMVNFYTITDGKKESITKNQTAYKSILFSSEFFNELVDILQYFRRGMPSTTLIPTTVLLPNVSFVKDVIPIPAIKNGGSNKASLNILIESLFKDTNKFEMSTFVGAQDKRQAVWNLTLIKKEILENIRMTLVSQKMGVVLITYYANGLVDAALQHQVKLRNSSFLLMDIQKNHTEFAFVTRGKTVGYYSLPFGHSILDAHKVEPEEMLFDHSYAELTVLNAKERAKAKALTVMESTPAEGETQEAASEEESIFGKQATSTSEETSSMFSGSDTTSSGPAIKVLPKKQPRKLPKFMLRDLPETEDGFLYENFRIFEKWALNLIDSNSRITVMDPISAVYVNLPKEFEGVLTKANEEKEENGVTFYSLGMGAEREIIRENLPLYGGFFAGAYNKPNNF